MQKVGDVTDTATTDGEFTDGSVASGINPTLLLAAIFNTWQRELCNVVTGSGAELDPENDGQILEAIQSLITGSIPAIPVTSVNTKTGDVILTAEDVGALPDTYAPPAAPVSSVNSKTGAVILAAADVHALPDTYVPPAPDLSAYLTSATASTTYQKINTASKAVNGWFKDTNTGVITQWGWSTTKGDSTVTFPIAFPAACTGVMCMDVAPSGTGVVNYASRLRGQASTTSFPYINNGNDEGLTGFYWEAKGY